ncbi:MAG: hypothetical protein C4341_00805 [Armatimonadota bacterium]
MRIKSVATAPDHPRIAELKRAAQGIETMFLKLLAAQLRKDGFGGFLGGGTAGEIYADFVDQAIAETLARGQGIGIARLITKTLEPRVQQRIAAEEVLRKRAENDDPSPQPSPSGRGGRATSTTTMEEHNDPNQKPTNHLVGVDRHERTADAIAARTDRSHHAARCRPRTGASARDRANDSIPPRH